MGALAAGCDPAGNPNHGLGDGGGGAGGGGGGAGGGGVGGGGGGTRRTARLRRPGPRLLHRLRALERHALLGRPHGQVVVGVGKFNTPKVGSSADVITDLAVAPDDTIYVVPKTNLYTAAAPTGTSRSSARHRVGMDNVAMTTTPDGKLWVADFKGAFCRIDPPPRHRR